MVVQVAAGVGAQCAGRGRVVDDMKAKRTLTHKSHDSYSCSSQPLLEAAIGDQRQVQTTGAGPAEPSGPSGATLALAYLATHDCKEGSQV